MKSTAWIDLGMGCAVRASEVAYVHAGKPPETMQMDCLYLDRTECAVWLTNGKAMPAYAPAATIVRRLEAAEEHISREEIAEAYNRGYNSGYVAVARRAEKGTKE